MVANRWPSVSLALLGATLLLGSGGDIAAARSLVDRPVIWHEKDRQSISEPTEREPNMLWDMFDDSVLLPTGRLLRPGNIVRRVGTLFGGDHVPPAANVNRLDEVPNCTWFTNRIGLFPMSPESAAQGPGPGTGPDLRGPWTIISAKTEGVTPGFVIRDQAGGVFLIKFDPPGELGMTTAAGVISGRILHAAGYNVPDDAVVVFRREDLILGEDVSLKLPSGSRRRMVKEDVDQVLSSVTPQEDGSYRAISSRYLDGAPVGPFNYIGRRRDDPNDRIKHQHRRELRGLRVFAAWLNHFDTKQHNSLDVFVETPEGNYVRHYLIDFASTLGCGANGAYPRNGFEHTVDPVPIFGRILALGLHQDDWRRLQRPAGLDEIGYFESKLFDPLEFKPLQPNSAFAYMTDRDAYWAAKIISAFTEEQLTAIVDEARYRNPDAARYMVRTLCERRDKIARCYFDRMPPLDFFVCVDGAVTFHDLGVERAIYPETQSRYRARTSVVDEEGHVNGWSEWAELSTLEIPIIEPASTRFPFVGVECQVDRGSGWSRPVRAYVSRRLRQVVAIER